METKYQLIGSKSKECEYYIIHDEIDKDNEKFSIFASHSEIWTERTRGKEFISIIDNGFGYVINFLKEEDLVFDSKKRTISMNHSTPDLLRILLSFINKQSKIQEDEFGVVEEKALYII
jgi:hypothetical protein